MLFHLSNPAIPANQTLYCSHPAYPSQPDSILFFSSILPPNQTDSVLFFSSILPAQPTAFSDLFPHSFSFTRYFRIKTNARFSMDILFTRLRQCNGCLTLWRACTCSVTLTIHSCKVGETQPHSYSTSPNPTFTQHTLTQPNLYPTTTLPNHNPTTP